MYGTQFVDPLGTVEVGEDQDVEQLGESRRRRGLEALAEACSISSKIIGRG